MKIFGECFCGETTYEVTGSLSDASSCHCSRCRKAFSSTASAYARVDPDRFRWTAGEELSTSYTGEHGYGLQFCTKCGSILCGTHDEIVHGVTLGCVNGDPGVEIARHIFVGSKASWDVLPAGVAMYEARPPPSD